jgi:hypothetical protein
MTGILKKSFDTSPDETKILEKGKMNLAKFGEVMIGRVILQPGWSWEKSIKPIQKTETCQSPPHIQFIISGLFLLACSSKIAHTYILSSLTF